MRDEQRPFNFAAISKMAAARRTVNRGDIFDDSKAKKLVEMDLDGGDSGRRTTFTAHPQGRCVWDCILRSMWL